MGLRLIIEDDEGATTIVPLGAETVTIGRQEGNTIQLTEKNVSRRHARLDQSDDGWVLEDLNSYNGVKVNGVSIEGKAVLQEGDIVQIGDYHLALCEDVDKKTLNLDRPLRAANDQEPLLASSSADLPRLTPTEMAEIQVERDAGGAKAAAVLSGSVPVLAAAPIIDDENEKKRGVGGLVFAAAAVLVVAGGVAVLMANRSGDRPPTEAPALARQDATAPGGVGPSPAPGAEPPAHVAVAGGGGEAAEPEVDEVLLAERDPGLSDPAPARSRNSAPKKSKSSRSSAEPKEVVEASPPPPPPPPAAAGQKPDLAKTEPAKPPAADPNQLLKDARAAQLRKDYARAYELAFEAYELRGSTDALKLMGVAACNMKSSGKAKLVYKKLRGSDQESLAKVCADNGITL